MTEQKREKQIKLQDYLKDVSPDCPIKLYDEGNDNRCVFDGWCGEMVEKNWFTNWVVTGHAFRDGEMLIWIK